MNKNELIRELQLSRGGSFSEAKDFLEAFIEIVTTELGHDGEINLQGFGSLKPWATVATPKQAQPLPSLHVSASNSVRESTCWIR